MIAWVREHGARYGADIGQVVVAGSSAGAHLVSTAALTADRRDLQPGFEAVDTSVTAVVALYGYFGTTDAGHGGAAVHDHIDSAVPPFFVVHGDQDTIVLARTRARLGGPASGHLLQPVVYAESPGRSTTSTCSTPSASRPSWTPSSISPTPSPSAPTRPRPRLDRHPALRPSVPHVAHEDLHVDQVVAALEALQSDAELATVRKRLPPDEPAIGVRMGQLFEVAKAHTDLPLPEVDRLLDHPAYEPRLAALCILDFQARRSLDDDDRRDRYDLYLRRHDRITTWDMVDRAAPRVVGRYLVGRPLAPLHDLAGRRIPSAAAPPSPPRSGSPATAPTTDSAESFAIAARLAADPEPVVHNAVGIFLKHAGARDPETLHRFLDEHAASLPRPALRLATEKLSPDDRARYRA